MAFLYVLDILSVIYILFIKLNNSIHKSNGQSKRTLQMDPVQYRIHTLNIPVWILKEYGVKVSITDIRNGIPGLDQTLVQPWALVDRHVAPPVQDQASYVSLRDPWAVSDQCLGFSFSVLSNQYLGQTP